MTAALYLLADGALSAVRVGDEVTLDGPEGRHATTVKRARVGESVLFADGSGLLATADVTSVASGVLVARVDTLEQAGPSGARFVLVQALAKGGRDEQAVEAATELGVDAVVAWQARRSVVVWKADKAPKALGKWETLVRAAAKQSRRATVPQVDGPVTTAQLAQRVAASALTLVLHEDATDRLAGGDLPDSGDVLIVVGPEGGIADDEVEMLTAAGARPVRLGSTVLRSSSAGPAALAVLNAATRWR